MSNTIPARDYFTPADYFSLTFENELRISPKKRKSHVDKVLRKMGR